MSIKGKTILITGGTGSFGQAFTRTILTKHKPKKVIIFSRDELKQYSMQQSFANFDNLRFFIGDVRDRERLHRALHGVNLVVHAAALKQVPTLEYNPFEAIKTNILGAENIINEAIDQGVNKVVALSTDKAANPINLYGATKLCAEKLFVAGNSYVGHLPTRFSVVRYGNVVGSRGSVIPYFLKMRDSGVLPITDRRMTRFWLTLDQAVAFVLDSFERMRGGEIFIPKIPSMKIMDLAEAIAPRCRKKFVGIRPGEKISEALITDDEARNTLEFKDHFVIQPQHSFWKRSTQRQGRPVSTDFRYTSDANTQWITTKSLARLIHEHTPHPRRRITDL